jgi:hypothetical protein
MESSEGGSRGLAEDPDPEPDGVSAPAVLRFQHSAAGSGVSRTGHIRPGGTLLVEYDVARISSRTNTSTADVVCHVRFSPGGQLYSGSVQGSEVGAAGAGHQAPFEVLVPANAASVELWFESREPSGTVMWDSRYGANYTFSAVRHGLPVPEPSVALRRAAIVDPSKIHVVQDAATKESTPIGSAGRRVQTALIIRALIEDPSTDMDAWADIHVFDGTDELVHAGSVVLTLRESRSDGALFVWEDVIYQGSGGGSGMGVWTRPDTHIVQYRLYCQPRRTVYETQAQAFTDAILHEFELPSDHEADGACERG